MILDEFDDQRIAMINPSDIYHEIEGFPTTLISVFSYVLFERLISLLDGKVIAKRTDVDGVWYIYEAKYKGIRFAFMKARIGAATCAGSFEEAIAFGAKRIILLGNCGVLDKRIEDCGIIIPTKAIRDEGFSYHYAPASDMIDVNHQHRTLFKNMLSELGYSYVEGITWTTDGFYRETKKKIQRRKEMGAICVEMECSAVQALCDFRGIDFFQFLYAGDNLDHPKWDPRSLNGYARLNEKEKIMMLAVELAYRIEMETK